MYLGRTHPPPSPFFLISSLTLSNQLLLGLYLLLLHCTSIPFRPPSYVALIFSHQMPIHLQCFPELPLIFPSLCLGSCFATQYLPGAVIMQAKVMHHFNNIIEFISYNNKLYFHCYIFPLFVSGLVERRPAPRRGFRGECCLPTALHRLCR